MEMQLVIIGQAVLAALLGGLIGFERRADRKEAGVRTYALVAMGAALFTSLSLHSFTGLEGSGFVDISRIMSQIVTGVGFLGAGIIIFREERVRGLTTAAGLWVCAAIGMAAGVGWYLVAISVTALVVLLLYVVGHWFPAADFQYAKKEKK